MAETADRTRDRPLPDADETSALVIDLVRTGAARTRPELVRLTGLGRTVVNLRVEQALDIGVLSDADLGPSTGGRAPRRLRFRAEAGHIYAVVLGTHHVSVGLTDLAGTVIDRAAAAHRPTDPPAAVLQQLSDMLDKLVGKHGVTSPLWGIALGIPGPVDFATGRSVGAPIMPGWEGFDVRTWFAEHYDAPVWVDNDLNLMVLGEQRLAAGPITATEQDIILIKISKGIGAGLVSHGRVHRGRNGSAGDIGHSKVARVGDVACRCGQIGCLEAGAGGWALARDATEAVAAGDSAFLAERLAVRGELLPEDIRDGARIGDSVCLGLVTRSAELVGETLAVLVSLYNPAVVYLGGIIPEAGDMYLAAVRRAVYRRSLPLATRDLQILPTTLDLADGIRAASTMVIERIFDRAAMELWLHRGSPAGSGDRLYGIV